MGKKKKSGQGLVLAVEYLREQTFIYWFTPSYRNPYIYGLHFFPFTSL